MAGTASDPFFWNDWQGDPLLRACTLAAQGLWMRFLCLMAESKKRGYLLLNGKKPADIDLAKVIGASVEEVQNLTSELIAKGVASEDRNKIVYCRRMVRDAKKRAASAKGGKIGGPTTLENKTGIHSTRAATRVNTRGATRHPRRAPSPSPSPISKNETQKVVLRDPELHQHLVADATVDEFAEWYAHYPRKVARAAAEKSYYRARRHLPQATLIEGVKRYVLEVSGRQKQHIAHPATWLNQQRWDDEEPETPASLTETLQRRAAEVLNGAHRRHLKNLEMTYPEDVPKRLALVEESAKHSNPVVWLNKWMWDRGASGCDCGEQQ